MGMLDSLKEQYLGEAEPVMLEEPAIATVPAEAPPAEEQEAVEEPAIEEPVVEEALVAEPAVEQPQAEEPVADEPVEEPLVAETTLQPEEPVALPEPEVISAPPVDFSSMPPPTAELRIAENGAAVESVTVRLRGGRPHRVCRPCSGQYRVCPDAAY